MKEVKIEINIRSYSYDELDEKDRQLIDAAKEATLRSYAPYSRFAVGAAVLLENGKIITGTNQENAAYPSGTCAERTTLFYANSEYPDQAVVTLAIAAKSPDGFLERPIPPCGSCRQVLLETEQRYKHPMRILLYSKNEIYLLQGTKNLLPLSFGSEFLK
ncbi:cytidine deaminase [uncultured Bacteroides sp.]|jgi:cytidine deaminase|uniref:cytidine deaminase n=1 Tax=uncultured Bacteroides sp. TaxID=162156 RepID=UPI00280BA319|nr:cytidine deaminase [uncultured Bacteroides sp.]